MKIVYLLFGVAKLTLCIPMVWLRKSYRVFCAMQYFVSKMMDKLRRIFKNVDPDSLPGQEFAKFDAVTKQILADMFVDMSIDAGENLSAIKDAGLLAKNTAQEDGEQQKNMNFKVPVTQNTPYRKPAYDEWDVSMALDDALDHADRGDDNLIRVGRLPNYIADLLGIEGDFYIYRNHAYENMVSREVAIADGRPVTRNGESIHFHAFGKEIMTEAIMSLENPVMTIAAKTADGNPVVIMILPIDGKNDAPLYSVLSFYSKRPINGDLSRKPHIVLTIAERDFYGKQGRKSGYLDIVGNAIKDGRVIDFDKKKRDKLSVIANPAGVGNITELSLADNLSQFQKEIKSFKAKNKIDYKIPISEDTSPRELLANALESTAQTDWERKKMLEYKEKASSIDEQEQKLWELKAQVKELSFAPGPRDKARLTDLRNEIIRTENRINVLDKQLLRLEASKPLQDVLSREKAAAYKRGVQKGKAAVEQVRTEYRQRLDTQQKEITARYQESRAMAVEGRHKTEMRHKIQKVIRNLNKLLNHGDRKRNVKEGMKELVAEAMTDILPESSFVEQLAQKHKNLFQTLLDKLKAFVESIKDHFASIGYNRAEEAQALKRQEDGVVKYAEQIVAMFDKIAVQAVERYQENQKAEKNTARKDGGVQMQIRKAFYSEFDAWDGKHSNVSFTVGTTSDVLKSIGMKDQQIKMHSGMMISKINKHPEITRDIFRQVPDLLENPIIVQFSDAIDPKTGKPKYDDSITVLGELYAKVKNNGKEESKPVLVALNLLPKKKNPQWS